VIERRLTRVQVSKRVPALERAIRILRLLGEHPQSQFTLSELAGRADVNLSTCHGILTCLTEEGIVVRHDPKRTYSLGPVLAELGTAAMNQHLGLPAAQQAISRITERYGLTALVGARMGDEIVVIANTTVDGRLPATPQGFRGPMIPPSGAVFMAWADSSEVQHWLSRLGPGTKEEDHQHHLRILEQTRQRGYLISLNGTLGQATIEYAAKLATTASKRARLGLVSELSDMLQSQEYALIGYPRSDFIAAPVFGPSGGVVLTLTVESPDGTMPVDKLDTITRALVKECRAVTSQIGGVVPTGVPTKT
jgi:DNA-binding IclR family transcriptional regulator